MYPGVVQHITVELGELRGGAEHGGLNLDAVQALDFGVTRQRRERHAAAETDYQHAAEAGVGQSAKMAQHELRSNVVVRSVGFAVGSKRDQVVRFGDGNGGVQTVGEIDDVQRVSVFPYAERSIEFPIEHGAERGHGLVIEVGGETNHGDSGQQHYVQSTGEDPAGRRCGVQQRGENQIGTGGRS